MNLAVLVNWFISNYDLLSQAENQLYVISQCLNLKKLWERLLAAIIFCNNKG